MYSSELLPQSIGVNDEEGSGQTACEGIGVPAP